MKVIKKRTMMSLYKCEMYLPEYKSNNTGCNTIEYKLFNSYETYYKTFTKHIGKFKYLKTMQMHSQDESNKEEPNKKQEEAEEPKADAEKHEYNCQCDKCNDKYGNLPLLVKVIEESEGESVSRDIYDQPSTSAVQLKTKKEITCNVCDKKFSHKGDYNKHLRKHTGEQPYKCDICFKKFSHTSNLSRHLKLHSGEKPFECGVCNKKFSRKDKLLSHQKSRLCRKKSD